MGPYTREALAEHRTAMRPCPADADAERRLYEQIGALYLLAEEADAFFAAKTGMQGDEDGTMQQQFADFLATVHEVARTARTPIGEALATATRRYERDRTGA